MKGAIFDLDGTVADNMRWHARAWMQLGDVSEDWVYARAGMKNEDLIPELVGRALTPAEVASYSERKEAAYRALYRPHLAPLPGLIELLDALAAAGVRCAVASAAPRLNRELLLDGLGLRARFAAEIGAEDVARGKPAPDLFLAAQRALGASECVVFEDAVNGVRAAVAANLPCAAVMTTASADALAKAGARWVLPDFRELPAELRRELGLHWTSHRSSPLGG